MDQCLSAQAGSKPTGAREMGQKEFMAEVKPKPEPTAEDAVRIAAAIRTAAEMGKRLRSAGLTERALVILLQDFTNVSQRDIKLILDALPKLTYYLTR